LDDGVGEEVGIIGPTLVPDVAPLDEDEDSGHAELGG